MQPIHCPPPFILSFELSFPFLDRNKLRADTRNNPFLQFPCLQFARYRLSKYAYVVLWSGSRCFYNSVRFNADNHGITDIFFGTGCWTVFRTRP